MALDKFRYKDEIIVYTGYKIENKFCFYYDKDDVMIYLSEYQVKKLQKINSAETDTLEE